MKDGIFPAAPPECNNGKREVAVLATSRLVPEPVGFRDGVSHPGASGTPGWEPVINRAC